MNATAAAPQAGAKGANILILVSLEGGEPLDRMLDRRQKEILEAMFQLPLMTKRISRLCLVVELTQLNVLRGELRRSGGPEVPWAIYRFMQNEGHVAELPCLGAENSTPIQREEKRNQFMATSLAADGIVLIGGFGPIGEFYQKFLQAMVNRNVPVAISGAFGGAAHRMSQRYRDDHPPMINVLDGAKPSELNHALRTWLATQVIGRDA